MFGNKPFFYHIALVPITKIILSCHFVTSIDVRTFYTNHYAVWKKLRFGLTFRKPQPLLNLFSDDLFWKINYLYVLTVVMVSI